MTSQEFDAYRHQAVHALMDLNEQCENGFHLNEWPRWSFDPENATLTFTRDGIPRVIADVQLVGSTSADGMTWRWGWANSSVPALVTARMQDVRKFGETEGLADFMRETLPADEYLGWEMTAIASRILGGKGGYRCPIAGELLYVVYMALAFAPQPEAANIDCAIHGRGFPTYVCEHLVTDPAQAWFSEEPTPANRWPDAWCSVCDAAYLEQGEWNERNAGRLNVKVICHRCYEGKRKQAKV